MHPKLSMMSFIEKCNETHHFKYDYSIAEYINCRSKIKIMCPAHGVFEQRAFWESDFDAIIK